MFKHPFVKFLILLALAYLFFTKGIGFLSSPIPSSLVRQYMGITLGVLLLYMASGEESWRTFKQPIHQMLIGANPAFKAARAALFVILPLWTAYMTYQRVKPQTNPPPPFRTVHPANPESMNFRGETYDLTSLSNPLREDKENYAAHLKRGKQVYYERCFYCHGDTWSGDGHFAKGFRPIPAKFTGDETLAILTESYVFWRIAKGGPGLPREATPWDSAMPAWEDRLEADEIWSVIMYLYDAVGKEPRRQGGHNAEEGAH